MKKILIIGKKSFIGSNLSSYLSKYYFVKKISFENVMKKKTIFFKNFSHIINTAIHKNYVNLKYDKNFDLDRKFIQFINNHNFIYIFLNTRKIYYQKANISEKSRIFPSDTYSVNKLHTEKFLLKKLKNKLVSLRISNVIGNRKNNYSRKSHNLFLDNFKKLRKSNKKITVNNEFKDFISIDQFSLILKKIIQSDINGIYNISLSQKVYVSEIVKWLDAKYFKKIKFIKSNRDSFTLSNKKLKNKIKINLTKKQLEKFCKNLI